jgi:hypothetical protein
MDRQWLLAAGLVIVVASTAVAQASPATVSGEARSQPPSLPDAPSATMAMLTFVDNACCAAPPAGGEESGSATEHANIELRVRKPDDSFRWRPALLQQVAMLSMQHAGNLAMDRWKRKAFRENPFFSSWFKSVASIRWSVWNDNDPFLDDYIAHPLMGAVYGYIQIQNDPRYLYVTFDNPSAYLRSRLRALAWVAAVSTEWKIGPLSEASIGNLGLLPYYSVSSKGMTNGTGMVDFVVTPIGGIVWLAGEDALDRYLVARMKTLSRNRVYRFALNILTPARSAANMLRLKSPGYRDRPVGLATAKAGTP